MKRILIVTDAWHPQVNGVVRTMQNVIDRLRARDIDVRTITPDMFLPCRCRYIRRFSCRFSVPAKSDK